MIWESLPWRRSILQRAGYLRGRLGDKRWPEISLARLEREVMLGFFEVRKLIEARKLSDRTVRAKYKLATVRGRGNGVTLMNWHRTEEHYDLDIKRHQGRDLLFITNQVIHSYVFTPVFSSYTRFDSVLISSDYKRNQEAYILPLRTIERIFRAVGRDSPAHMTGVFNPKTRDFEFRKW